MSNTPNSPADRSGCLFSLKLVAAIYLLMIVIAFIVLLFAGATMDNAIAMSIIWPYYLPIVRHRHGPSRKGITCPTSTRAMLRS